MASQHKYNPISFRPPEEDRVWLVEQAKEWDMPVNELLTRALREYRARWETGYKLRDKDEQQCG